MAKSIVTGDHTAFASAGGSTITKEQVAHGFSLLEGIYHNGTSWIKAKASLADEVAVYCISKVVDLDNFEATKFGSITAEAHGMTVGEYYFLDTAVAGTPIITPPTSGFNNPLFYVEDIDTVHMTVHRAIDITDVPTVTFKGYNSSEWVPFTPVGSFTNTTHIGRWRRVGDSMEMRVTSLCTGAPGVATYNIVIPGNHSIDGLKLNGALSTLDDNLGHAFLTDADIATNRMSGKVYPQSATSIQIISDESTIVTEVLPFTFAVNDTISFLATIPIEGWENVSTKVVIQNEISNPNLLINGNFDLWQRGTTGSISGDYTADRWRWFKGGGAAAWERIISSQNIPDGASYAYRLSTSNPTDNCSFLQTLELSEVEKLRNQVITFSFKLRKSTDFDHSSVFRIYEGDTANSSSTSGDTILATTTIQSSEVSASEWRTFSITATVPSDSNHLRINCFINGDGIGTGANQFYFSQAKLERGAVATAFIPASLAEETKLCQRYYEKSYDLTVVPGTNGSVGSHATSIITGWLLSEMNQRMITEKNKPPILTYYAMDGTVGSGSEYNSGGTFVMNQGLGSGDVSTKAFFVGSSTGGFTVLLGQYVRYHFVADAELY